MTYKYTVTLMYHIKMKGLIELILTLNLLVSRRSDTV